MDDLLIIKLLHVLHDSLTRIAPPVHTAVIPLRKSQILRWRGERCEATGSNAHISVKQLRSAAAPSFSDFTESLIGECRPFPNQALPLPLSSLVLLFPGQPSAFNRLHLTHPKPCGNPKGATCFFVQFPFAAVESASCKLTWHWLKPFIGALLISEGSLLASDG